ncbi:MAG: penicillin-binding transpeptidase domain-containing protein [Mycobacterium leprae]
MGLRNRNALLRVGVVGALVVLTGRMAWLQGVKAGDILDRGEGVRVTTQQVMPVRGAIMDRNGRYLAISTVSHTIVANMLQITTDKQDEVAGKLSPLLGMTKADILAKFRANPDSGYVPLKDGLDLDSATKVQDLGINGISLVQHTNRTYPQGFTANQVVGYIDEKGHGQYGLEGYYDKQLSGQPGTMTAEFTSSGTPIENTIRATTPSVPGANLVLSIDAALQTQVEQKLAQVVKDYDAKRALVMAMDVHTGELLVMAMSPGANPGDRSTWGNPVDWGRVNNWAISDPLSPGSIFKTITTSIALEEHTITPSTSFMDSGWLVRDGRRIANWDGYVPPKPTPSTIAELLQRSSNVGLIQVGETIPHEAWIKYMQAYGFMDKTGVDLSAENTSFFGTPFSEKKVIDWANMYIGQHLMVTPLQMITAECAIANGGYLVQPHLVRQIQDPTGKVVWTAPTTPKRQVISTLTTQEERPLLQSVIYQGTATSAQVPGYTIAGKTGTAQKFDDQGNMKDRMLADFIGMVPAQNPQIVVLVMVDEPKGDGYGGVVAAPIFHDLLPSIMRSINIMPDSPAALGQEKAPPKVTAGVMPNVVWQPAARAQSNLVQAGYVVRTTGQGDLVASQSVKAGSLTKPGTTVELTLTPKPAPGAKVHVPDFTGFSLAEAGQLADEIGLTLKAGGTGFVAAQDTPPGTEVPARSVLSVRLAPPSTAPPNTAKSP